MSIIVQKFGGTSVADTEKILTAARKAIRAQQEGHQVVMVVSAMGKNTDMLVELAGQISERPPAREMDMLLSTGEQVSVALMAMAIDSLGHKATSLTGAQIGIRTDSTHTKARIKSISTKRMQELLDDGNIVIAAGFQGIDENLDITTLGRGGSDTTAVALAAVLQADACEIYTDVDGVYTTDPRLVAEARRMSQVSYDEMLEMASLGAGVMHNRSIEFAKKYGVPIHVRHAGLSDSDGSLIVAQTESLDAAVCGAAVTRDEARITVRGVPDEPGASLQIFAPIAQQAVTVDMIVQNVGEGGTANISFTVPQDELETTLAAIQPVIADWPTAEVTHDAGVAKVSVVGLGMANMTGVANKMFHSLSENGVNIQMITTSEIKISVLVDREEAMPALRTVHKEFELHKPPKNMAPRAEVGNRRIETDVTEVIARLRGSDMEELFIDQVELDSSQARITIKGVPNKPGIASKVFDAVAKADIFVDMIVQSFGENDSARMSFTTPAENLTEAVKVCEELSKSLGCGGVTSVPKIAKLTVTGIGLRSHTGVAIRTFRSLAEAGINVGMINTSEVSVNVVVEHDQGQQALECLQNAFADALA